MKKLMKKLLAVVAAMTMVMGLAVTANAQSVTYSGDGATTNGKITVTNATQGQTYTLYKIFDATVASDATNGQNATIAYTLPSGKSLTNNDYFEIVPGTTNNVQVKENVDIDALNKASVNGTTTSDPTKAEGDAFIQWLKSFGTQVSTPIVADASGEVEWDNIPYGYYYVSSTLGSLVTINSTQPAKDITDKNTKNPATDATKKIVETTTGTDGKTTTTTADTATAKIGDTVKYQITFTAQNYDAANNKVYQYVIADDQTGLDIDTESFEITIVKGSGSDQYKVNGTIAHEATITKAAASADNAGDVTITIPWAVTTTTKDDDGNDVLNVGDFYYQTPATVTITYSAKLTATTGSNKATVTYNDGETGSKTDEPKVYTAEYDLTKVAADSKQTTQNEDGTTTTTYSKSLSGAEFDLYDAAGTVSNGTVTGGNKIAVVQDTDAQGKAIAGSYTVDPNGTSTAKLVVDSDGKVTIKGLKQGTQYYLQETKAPDGYTLPTARIALSASTGNKAANETVTENVENTKGSTLPSTGGMGTTIFYVLGAALVIGAGVVLVTRRRLSR